MDRLRGRVTTGIGDLARWMRTYADVYERRTGVALFPGSLNVTLDHEYHLPPSRLLSNRRSSAAESA
jgi:CTP-dependent riboflavin kinase